MKYKALVICLKLLRLPVFAGLVLSVLWYVLLFRNGVHFPKADESAFTDTIIPGIINSHGLAAGLILIKLGHEFNQIQTCVRMGKEKEFRQIRDNRIAMPIHLLLSLFAFLSVGLTMLLSWESPLSGACAVFSLTLLFGTYYEVATNLDDPQRAVWFLVDIPPAWFEPEKPKTKAP